jgi:2-polyprenyl-3-methyl-5-hydroxy-6-metoxy-1,4-benzoquinol methylase/ribosomal protein S27E
MKNGVKMKETDIRPNGLMQEHLVLHREDIRQLIRHKRNFIKISCPACQSDNSRTLFEKDHFTFVACMECGTVFINPRPTLEMLARFYKSSKSINYWNDVIFPASEHSRRNQIFIPRAKRVVELCKKYNVSAETIIEVGAGFGTFCEEIKKLDFFKKIIAIEPSHELAETCRLKNIPVIEKPVEEIDTDGLDAGIVAGFELMEHLYCPGDFLRICENAMRKGGLLILTTPNIKGFDLLVLDRLSDNIIGPNHLNYFNTKSVKHLLEQYSFEVIDITTPGKLDAEIVRKKILNGELDISKRPFLKEMLIEQWEAAGASFQSFLADNYLSSHMWVIARKK